MAVFKPIFTVPKSQWPDVEGIENVPGIGLCAFYHCWLSHASCELRKKSGICDCGWEGKTGSSDNGAGEGITRKCAVCGEVKLVGVEGGFLINAKAIIRTDKLRCDKCQKSKDEREAVKTAKTLTCKKCGETKPRGEFRRSTECKECSNRGVRERNKKRCSHKLTLRAAGLMPER